MEKRVTIVENILNANDRLAAENQSQLDKANVFSLNIMASPGAGKTSLIEHTIKLLSPRFVLQSSTEISTPV
jgi:hydrogenase nickel incorporation protein HypB